MQSLALGDCLPSSPPQPSPSVWLPKVLPLLWPDELQVGLWSVFPARQPDVRGLRSPICF